MSYFNRIIGNSNISLRTSSTIRRDGGGIGSIFQSMEIL